MRTAPNLFNEEARLAALAEYDLASQNAEVDLSDIVELAARLFDVPTVLISVIARDQQFVKAGTGIDVCELDRRHSFCAHALERPDIMVVPDATLDLRFAKNPFVTGEPRIRFYAGVALRSPEGHSIGSLCLIDHRPRRGLTDAEQINLHAVARLALDKLEMRRLAIAGAAGQSRFENIASTSPDGIIRIWLADITYIATGEGWLYLAAVLDLATRKIVGWAMRDHMRTELPLAAMMMAAQRQRPAPGLICHSDRGSQYAAGTYVDYLSAIRAVPSMSRTANCYDNAPMESFFHTLKVELVHQCRWTTQSEARQALFGYIEGYYNRHRMHSAFGYLTPEQAEQRMTG